MIGIAVGIIEGVVQYLLLLKFTSSISKGTIDTKAVLLGLLQFFLPMGVLIAMAFLRRSDLLWTAVGISVSLLICAVTKFVLGARKTRGREDKK
jgi:hypothetical protein